MLRLWKRTTAGILLSTFLLLTACTSGGVTLEHIHGLGYTGDGKQLLIPAHHGLVAYSNGQWSEVDTPKHDYMGFVTVEGGFYSSGHPAKGSTLKEPMGVVKSPDLGKTITPLDLHGAVDFHLMAVGYKNQAIYVYSDHPNARMKTPGVYYSKDDAKTWSQSGMKGYTGEPMAMAVHPTNDKVVALAGKNGLYVSTDNGNQFQPLLPQMIVTAVTFDSNGVLLAAAANSPSLMRLDIATKEKKDTKLPALEPKDAVSYIAVNPTNANEVSIATFMKDVYTSKDAGATWTQIAVKGKGQ